MKLQNKIPYDEIIKFLKIDSVNIKYKKNSFFTNFKPITTASKNDISFCSILGKKGISLILHSSAGLILCPYSFKNKIIKKNFSSTLLFVRNPRLEFIRCLKNFSQFKKPKPIINKKSIILSTKIGKNVHIGPFCYIGSDVTIGNNVIIHANIHVYNKCVIGNNVEINPFAVIGQDGFGFERNENDELEKFPHIGGVEIHDDVEIGSNCCIDRGTLANTIIGEGTKIDNLVHVAHNVKIGKHCFIVAQSFLGGSCTLDDYVHVAMSVSIRDGIKIGKNAIIGMGAVVTKNVSENTTVIGVPAKPI